MVEGPLVPELDSEDDDVLVPAVALLEDDD